MCGIFYLNVSDKKIEEDLVRKSANSINHRGPDNTTFISPYNQGELMGFHRLCINGTSALANQPMTLNGITYLICNGEIYNHLELQNKYNIECTSGSDCEIILHLFEKIGFEATVKELDGEFAMVLVTPTDVYIARDPYGVRALYAATADKHSLGFGFASECKALYSLFPPEQIQQFPPGTIRQMTLAADAEFYYYNDTVYYKYPEHFIQMNPYEENMTVFNTLRNLLVTAVKKRMMCARQQGRAIGAYLSGGFDSSVIASILQRELTPGQPLETFSIGFTGSPDLLYAKKVAEYIGSKHHEYIITEREALDAIPAVVRAIESYDITTVRASTMMYLLSKYVREHSDVVVLLSGEGSDEASGSYRYFHNAPSHTDFHQETVRLLKDLCYFDNLRADKSSAAWGLEVRVPFLDLDFLKYYMTLSPAIKTQHELEKYALRKSLAEYLPEEVLYRPKEAMSDGVSLHGRSWSTIIQAEAIQITGIVDGFEAEKTYYLNLFQQYYRGCEKQIPYYWLPKWCGEVKDPSARVLSIYNANC
jgi:asparagine synthase (glutamine-hydrolysing)